VSTVSDIRPGWDADPDEMTDDDLTALRDPRLAQLLAAASAPATAAELRGEQAMLTAFRSARPGRRRRGWIARLLSVKVIAATAAALTAGGLAVAAGNGALPLPGFSDTPTTPGRKSARPSAVASVGPGVPGPTPSGSPVVAAQVKAGCTGFLAMDPQQRARQLAAGKFDELVAAAGGADRVEQYCQALVGTPHPTDHQPEPTKTHPAPPSRPPHPTNTRTK
jgi:hypothetical protein